MARATRSQRQPSQSQSQSQSQPTQTQTQRRRRATREDEDEDEEYGRGAAGRRRQDDDEDEEDGEGGEDEDGDEDMGGGESVSPLSFVYLLPQLFPPTTHYCWDLIFLSGYFFILLLQSFSWPLWNPDRIYANFLKKPKLNCVWKRRGLFLPLLQINMIWVLWMGDGILPPFVLPTKPIIRLIQMFALGLWILLRLIPAF